MSSNRRQFLKQSTYASASVLAAPFIAKRLGADPVRVGIIGCGNRGRGITKLINNIEGLRVSACADPLPFRLERCQELAGNVSGYPTHTELLSDSEVDAVIIATPFSTHDEVALAALSASKHIYCEKTMIKDLEPLQMVLNQAKTSAVVFQTGHQYHSSPLYQRAREIIQAGHIGSITAFECQWNRNGDWRRKVPDPKWERMINWRMYREYSGGLPAELMSHQMDFVNWVTGMVPEKVMGFGGIDHWKDGRETFDNAHVLFEYPNGMDASFRCTTTNGYADYQIKVLGKKGTMILDYKKGWVYAERKALPKTGTVDGVSGATIKAWEQGEGVPIDAPGNDPTINALEQFRDAIVKGISPISDIQTGATTAKCVHIALDALHKGGVKHWSDYPELVF